MKLRSLVRAVGQYRNVRRALQPLRSDGSMSVEQMQRFRTAFTNEGYSGNVDYLMAVASALRNGPVLECGSGATTLLASVLGSRHGFHTYSLEQDGTWTSYVKRFLNGSRSVSVITAPLVDGGGFLWYRVTELFPKHFPLIICDGPSIYGVPDPYFSAWRYGVLAWLNNTGRTFDTLLLDDVDEKRGMETVERWKVEFNVTADIVGSESAMYSVIRPSARSQLNSSVGHSSALEG